MIEDDQEGSGLRRPMRLAESTEDVAVAKYK